jgi:hypothetical protein
MKITIKTKISINVYTIIFLLSLIVMSYYFLPITASVLTASMMLGVLGILYFMIFINSNWKSRKEVFGYLLLICSLGIVFCVREYYKEGIIGVYSILLVFFPIFLVFFLFNKEKYEMLKKLAVAVLLMLVITGITTFTGLTVYPELARDLAAFSNDNIIGISTRYNIGGYDIVYCVVLAIPLYCLVIEKKVTTGIKKFLEIFIFIISLIFIVKTQYTTAMLLEIVSFGMIILIRKFDLKRLGILALLGLIILSVYKGEISNGLIKASYSIESQSISQRLEELAKALDGGKVTGEDMTERGNAYGKSIEAFLEHPVLGTWISSDNIELGGHSTVLDLMAGVGLPGFLLILYTFFYIEKLMLSRVEKEITRKYVGIFLVVYIILAVVNPIISGTFFSVLFIGLPGIVLMENK